MKLEGEEAEDWITFVLRWYEGLVYSYWGQMFVMKLVEIVKFGDGQKIEKQSVDKASKILKILIFCQLWDLRVFATFVVIELLDLQELSRLEWKCQIFGVQEIVCCTIVAFHFIMHLLHIDIDKLIQHFLFALEKTLNIKFRLICLFEFTHFWLIIYQFCYLSDIYYYSKRLNKFKVSVMVV